MLVIEGVHDAQRDAHLCRRHDSFGVQHLGAKVGEFRRLAEGYFWQRLRLWHDTRIGGHDAINVRPDLDLIRLERRAQDSGGVIAAAATQRGDHALLSCAHKAGHHRNAPALEHWRQSRLHLRSRLIQQRRRLAKVIVRHDQRGRLDRLGFEAGGGERARQHRDREALAERGDQIQTARRQLAQDGHAATPALQII